MSMRSEIGDQPTVIAEALDANRAPIDRLVVSLSDRPFEYALIAARGTSDNAARYAKYVWGSRNRLPVALAAPSLFTSYQTRRVSMARWSWASPNRAPRPIWWRCSRKVVARDARRWPSRTSPTPHWQNRRTP